MAPQLASDDYTVGWIAALPEEAVAAEAMLDEKHELPLNCKARNVKDTNSYTLGSIKGPAGEHNVVIANLPAGRYGTTSAATVAAYMVSTFPNIKFGLMVGIGGGIPSDKNDIRLGDLVVSQPEGAYGGVRQYNCGKENPHCFEESGSLNSPPTVLLNALSRLQRRHIMDGGSTIPRLLQTMCDRYPALAKPRKEPGFVHQGLDYDRLFPPDYEHVNPSNKMDCSECSKDGEVVRDKRQDQEPEIHYGTIASGDRVIRNARLRDSLAKDCLCFETEAAGLMNDFPCLVVRGICDYCDSHKNYRWQNYAAATAAAFAKEILQLTDVADVRCTPRAQDVIQELQKLHQKVTHVQEELTAGFSSLHKEREESERIALLNEITPVDYGPQYSDIIAERQEGTGQQLLRSSEYQTWSMRNSKSRTLFCPGIPGAGKTVTSAVVIHDLFGRFQHDPQVGIAYIFCSFRRYDEQNLEHLLSSLLKQLAQPAQRWASISEEVKSLYSRHKDGRTRPSVPEIMALLQSVASAYATVFILVDALDECQTTNGCRTNFLSKIFDLQNKVGANIFATCRDNDEIARSFDGCKTWRISATNDDISLYLRGKMQTLGSASDVVDDEIQRLIETAVVKAADGMFLFAVLQVQTLLDLPTKGEIKTALQNLPRGPSSLFATYEQAVRRIESQPEARKVLAKKVLSWIVFAKRQLSSVELRHAVAIRTGATKLDDDHVPRTSVIKSICAGLVTTDEDSGIIRLVHYTTQEFFAKQRSDWFRKPEASLAKACLTYLSFSVFETGICSPAEFQARFRSHHLYDYAVSNWHNHARASDSDNDESIRQLILDILLSKNNLVFTYIQALEASQTIPTYVWSVEGFPAINFAARCGLPEVVSALLDMKHHPDTTDRYRGRTPLHRAAEYGREAVVKLLLDKGARPDAADRFGYTPLHLAASEGNKAVAELFLDSDTRSRHPDPQDDDGRTPLHKAADMGHEAVVELLMEHAANPNFADKRGGTPLHLAAAEGYAAVMKLLLQKGARCNCRDHYGRTPLHFATGGGHTTIVELLLGYGADPNIVDLDRETSLHAAAGAWSSHMEPLVRLLLQHGAHLDARNVDGDTPLLLVVDRLGRKWFMKLLLESGANPNSRGRDGQTPLHRGVLWGSNTAVELLLGHGADPDPVDQYGKTPLHIATEDEDLLSETAVTLLLRHGADPYRKDADGKTPLDWAVEQAVEQEDDTILRLFIGNGANVNHVDYKHDENEDEDSDVEMDDSDDEHGSMDEDSDGNRRQVPERSGKQA